MNRKMSRKKQSNYTKLVILLSILLILTLIISGILFYYVNQFKKPLKIMNLKTNITISEKKIGFELGYNDSITFGTIKRGSTSKRDIVLINTYAFPAKAVISCNGSICPKLSFDEEIPLEPNSQKSVEFLATSHPDDSLGYFQGTITIKIFRAVK